MHTSVLIIYCLAALVASLAGGSLPSLLRLTHHTRLQLATRFGIVSAPAILLFSGGKVCHQFVGELSRRELDDLLAQANVLARVAKTSARQTVAQTPESI
ncbi:MAG: thioredoxin family protein [Verrucomicrobia bacterium]|jgi:thioredoxin-like negative regulator of GroEL|nr:thioredoxin family protein [Verrucomicrobiota bacterium]